MFSGLGCGSSGDFVWGPGFSGIEELRVTGTYQHYSFRVPQRLLIPSFFKFYNMTQNPGPIIKAFRALGFRSGGLLRFATRFLGSGVQAGLKV